MASDKDANVEEISRQSLTTLPTVRSSALRVVTSPLTDGNARSLLRSMATLVEKSSPNTALTTFHPQRFATQSNDWFAYLAQELNAFLTNHPVMSVDE
jgi:hypothetical protein